MNRFLEFFQAASKEELRFGMPNKSTFEGMEGAVSWQCFEA